MVAYGYWQKRERPKIDAVDFLIVGYVLWMLIATWMNDGTLRHYVFGGRYDFEFLFAFIVFKHSLPLLP